MTSTLQHPQLPWITCGSDGVRMICRCAACGAVSGLVSPPEADQFAHQHANHTSAAPTHYGAGDLVAGATKALGIQSCTPCEQRRMALNNLMPRFWRR